MKRPISQVDTTARTTGDITETDSKRQCDRTSEYFVLIDPTSNPMRIIGVFTTKLKQYIARANVGSDGIHYECKAITASSPLSGTILVSILAKIDGEDEFDILSFEKLTTAVEEVPKRMEDEKKAQFDKFTEENDNWDDYEFKTSEEKMVHMRKQFSSQLAFAYAMVELDEIYDPMNLYYVLIDPTADPIHVVGVFTTKETCKLAKDGILNPDKKYYKTKTISAPSSLSGLVLVSILLTFDGDEPEDTLDGASDTHAFEVISLEKPPTTVAGIHMRIDDLEELQFNKFRMDNDNWNNIVFDTPENKMIYMRKQFATRFMCVYSIVELDEVSAIAEKESDVDSSSEDDESEREHNSSEEDENSEGDESD